MATPTIKAIETRYAGCRFRSRLEARWAVFFDHLGMAWEHEAQGFLIDGHRYLPDFHLHGDVCDGADVAVEVKGALTGDDLQKILLLALTGQQVLLLQDIPRGEGANGPHFWLFRRNLGKGNSIGLETAQVGFYELGSVWGLVPFGWPNEISKALDNGVFRNWLAAEIQQLGISRRGRGGWVRVPAAVANAYEAARSARFEHGEHG